jgi:hypothetical protein
VVAQQLEASPSSEPEPPAEAAERIAYGILAAALEEGLVTALQRAMDVLKRFSLPPGPLGEQWLSEQEGKLSREGPSDSSEPRQPGECSTV